MDIWTYDAATGELIECVAADESPLEPGVWIVPAHATTTEPPPAVAGQARVWRDDAWGYVPDHRGELRWLDHATSYVVTKIGEPEGEVDKPPRPLADAQSARIAEAWAVMQSRVDAATVTVATAAGTHQYGLDAVTQDNLQKALLAVFLGITPNPRPWTPKGASAPISISHDEVRTIAGAVGLAYDGYMQAYLAHKRGIMAADTADAVVAYDLTQGWPA